MRIIEASDFEKNAAAILSSCGTNQETMVIKDRNGQEVVMSPMTESWKETLYLTSNATNTARLMRSIDQAKRGEFVAHELIEI